MALRVSRQEEEPVRGFWRPVFQTARYAGVGIGREEAVER